MPWQMTRQEFNEMDAKCRKDGIDFWKYQVIEIMNEDGIRELDNGLTIHYKDNTRHREDGPAEYNLKTGYEAWFINGEPHRVDGPAITYPNGSVFYMKNGEFNREDGPAVVQKDGHTEWRLNGRRHRLDGPAVTYADGSEFWYFDNKLHRVDGPAVTKADRTTIWYKHGLIHRYDGMTHVGLAIVLPSEKYWSRGVISDHKIYDDDYLFKHMIVFNGVDRSTEVSEWLKQHDTIFNQMDDELRSKFNDHFGLTS